MKKIKIKQVRSKIGRPKEIAMMIKKEKAFMPV